MWPTVFYYNLPMNKTLCILDEEGATGELKRTFQW